MYKLPPLILRLSHRDHFVRVLLRMDFRGGGNVVLEFGRRDNRRGRKKSNVFRRRFETTGVSLRIPRDWCIRDFSLLDRFMGRRIPKKQMLFTVLRAQLTLHVGVFDMRVRYSVFGNREGFRGEGTRTKFDQRYHRDDEENVRHRERELVRGTDYELGFGVCANGEFSVDGGVEKGGERVLVERVRGKRRRRRRRGGEFVFWKE